MTKRHISSPQEASEEETVELLQVIQDAASKLCEATGTTYTDQETVGFNRGKEAGQTVMHAHVHILPVAVEDPAEMKQRGGIGGAF